MFILFILMLDVRVLSRREWLDRSLVLYTIKSLSKESQVAPVKNVHAYLSNEAKAAKIEETKTSNSSCNQISKQSK